MYIRGATLRRPRRWRNLSGASNPRWTSSCARETAPRPRRCWGGTGISRGRPAPGRSWQPGPGGLHCPQGGNAQLAAQYFEQSGRYMDAGRLTMQEGNVGKALLLFEKALKLCPASEALTPLRAAPEPGAAGRDGAVLRTGQAYTRAAEVYESLHRDLQAGPVLGGVPRATPRPWNATSGPAHPSACAALAETVKDTPLDIQAEALAARGETEEAARLFVRAGKKREGRGPVRIVRKPPERRRTPQRDGRLRDGGQPVLPGPGVPPRRRVLPAGPAFRAGQAVLPRRGRRPAASRMAFESGEWEEAVELAHRPTRTRRLLLQRLQALPETAGDPPASACSKPAFSCPGPAEVSALTCLEGLSEAQGDREIWRLYVMGRAHQDLGAGSRRRKRTEARGPQRRFPRMPGSRLDEVSGKPTGAPGRRATADTRSAGQAWAGPLRDLVSRAGTRPSAFPCGSSSPPPGPRAAPRPRTSEDLQKILGLTHPAILALRDVDRERTTPAFRSTRISAAGPWPNGSGRVPALPLRGPGQTQADSGGLAEAHARHSPARPPLPDAVFMDNEGRVKVQGFGLVHISADDLSWRLASDPLALYLPAGGSQHKTLTTPADLYGAGAVLMHLLTGPPPVGADEVSGDIPTADDQAFSRACPCRRP